ncbi:MAG: Uma2 family endonuclease [Microcoleus sp. PH2017_17_BER_D_A]|nr:Uma2 family endonuclease [Microcoleus sp. PH2017_17_BER_D_A]
MTASTEIREEVIERFRSEYHDGKIIPMTGGTPNHNQIALNFGGAINFATIGKAYRVNVNDLRLWIPSKRVYTYPDVMVVAGKLEFLEGRKDTITNAVMVAEVLSKSTANYDRGDKFKLFRTIPTLREYILIDQYEMHVEQFSKTDDNKWVLSELSLGEMYDRVDFESESD